jgi:hypothetical protein
MEDQQGRLISPNQGGLKFASLKTALAKLPVDDAILDATLSASTRTVSVDSTSFSIGRRNLCSTRSTCCGSTAKTCASFRESNGRRASGNLSGQPKVTGCYSHNTSKRGGKRFSQEIRARDLEGTVAKRKQSVCRDGGNSWLKVKNASYTPAEGRHEPLTHQKK